VDNFKKFNDTHGTRPATRSSAGSRRSCGSASGGPTSSPGTGGEEFVVLLPDTNKEDTRILAERIRAATESHPFPAERPSPGEG